MRAIGSRCRARAARLLRWLASGEDWTINAPAAYFAILPFCGPEFAALQSPLSEVLPYFWIATMVKFLRPELINFPRAAWADQASGTGEITANSGPIT